MPRLRLLGVQIEDVSGICISAETQEDLARREQALRAEAQRLHTVWLATGDNEAKMAFAKGLRAWGEYVGDQRAINHAYELAHGVRCKCR